MNEKKEKISIIDIILSIIAAVIAAVGLTCDMTGLYVELDSYMEKFPAFMRAIFRMVLVINPNRIYLSFVIIAILVLILYSKRFTYTKRDNIMAGFFAAFFSIMQIIALSFDTNNSADFIRVSAFVFIRAFFYTAGYMIVWFHVTRIVLKKYDLLVDKNAFFDRQMQEYDTKKHMLKYMLIMLLCWLPYYILLFPGTGNGDTSRQIIMFFHERKDMLLDYSPNVTEDMYITNMHPFFTTIVFGLFAKLGVNVFGNIDIGVGIYTFIQMVLYAGVFSYTICYFEKLGMNNKLKTGLLVFLSICPLYPLYSICMLKDTMFALTYIILTLMMCEIFRTKGECLRSWKFVICMMLISALFTLTKNQGVYFLIVILVVSLIAYRKYILKLLISFGIPVVFFIFIWSMLILPAAKVASGGKQEMLGALFQCTARYIKEYPDEVTKEEKEAISKVLDYDKLPELYSAQLQDPVKFTFNQLSTSEDMKGYFDAFFSMFRKHPVCYIDAVINNAFGFFDVSRMSKMAYTYFWNRIDEDNKLYVGGAFPKIQKIGYKLIFFIQRIPVINVIMSVGTYTMFSIFMILLVIRNRQYGKLYPLLITILSILILVISPAGGNFRYTMPMFMLLIFNMLLVCCGKLVKASENTERKEEKL
ncbi:hypothetical protein SAMN06297422_10214 [Lachnospiraceae bacterium]|nr:hypothetical protein SAMN06297422_10214 [Lachnospiraceae bacterium]